MININKEFKIGDKIMGYDPETISILIGGTIIDADSNRYLIDLNPDIKKYLSDWPAFNKDNRWIKAKYAKLFNKEMWNKAFKHYKLHIDFKSKSYYEYIRMVKSLEGENDEIGDDILKEQLNKELSDLLNKDD